MNGQDLVCHLFFSCFLTSNSQYCWYQSSSLIPRCAHARAALPSPDRWNTAPGSAAQIARGGNGGARPQDSGCARRRRPPAAELVAREPARGARGAWGDDGSARPLDDVHRPHPTACKVRFDLVAFASSNGAFEPRPRKKSFFPSV